MKNRSGRESSLQKFERNSLLVTKNELGVFSGESGKRNNNIRKVENEPTIKIGKAKERLHVPDLPRFGPVLDDFDLVGRHKKAFR